MSDLPAALCAIGALSDYLGSSGHFGDRRFRYDESAADLSELDASAERLPASGDIFPILPEPNSWRELKIKTNSYMPTRYRIRFPKNGPYYQRRIKRSAVDERNWKWPAEPLWMVCGNVIVCHPDYLPILHSRFNEWERTSS